jgi:hypothetical protein
MAPRNEVLKAVKDELDRQKVPYTVEHTNGNHLKVKFSKFLHIVSLTASDHRAPQKARCLVRRDLRSVGHPGL